jgi:hypothetical protein
MTAETTDTAHAGGRPGTAAPPRMRRLGLALVVISMAPAWNGSSPGTP